MTVMSTVQHRTGEKLAVIFPHLMMMMMMIPDILRIAPSAAAIVNDDKVGIIWRRVCVCVSCYGWVADSQST